MTVGVESTKRRRLDVDDPCFHRSNNLQKDIFYVTFNSFGTIPLSKAALQNFPSSLLTQTLLNDSSEQKDNNLEQEDNNLFVPIGRGLRSFPALIEEI